MNTEFYELHRQVLGALLSQNLPVEQKLAIIDREYDIPLEIGRASCRERV